MIYVFKLHWWSVFLRCARLSRVALLVLAATAPLATRGNAAELAVFEPARPAEPVIAARRVVVTDFGAVPDGVTLNHEAFARAIDAVAAQGGGTVVVPAGVWHTGPIRLRSGIRLHLEAGALIRFSREFALYPMHVFNARGERSVDTLSPLSAEDAEDIAITGDGVIDGGGDAWRLVKRGKVTDGFWKALVASGGVLNAKGDEWWPTPAALSGAAGVAAVAATGSLAPADYEPYRVFLRPRLVRLLNCRRVLIEGVTFRNAPNWTVHPWLCEDVTIRQVKVFNAHHAQNSDGIDIDSCRRVVVRGCIVDTGDDGLCIKSGLNEAGRRIGVPSEEILVEDCVVYEGHGGVTIGSEMSGGVRRVLVRNCTFIGTDIGLRFKTARGRGGVVEDLWFERIRMTGIKGNAIDFNFAYFQSAEAAGVAQLVDEGTPTFRRIGFADVRAVEGVGTLVLRGLPERPLSDIVFRDVSLTGQRGAEIAYATRVTFTRVTIRAAGGPALTANAVTESHLPLAP